MCDKSVYSIFNILAPNTKQIVHQKTKTIKTFYCSLINTVIDIVLQSAVPFF